MVSISWSDNEKKVGLDLCAEYVGEPGIVTFTTPCLKRICYEVAQGFLNDIVHYIIIKTFLVSKGKFTIFAGFRVTHWRKWCVCRDGWGHPKAALQSSRSSRFIKSGLTNCIKWSRARNVTDTASLWRLYTNVNVHVRKLGALVQVISSIGGGDFTFAKITVWHAAQLVAWSNEKPYRLKSAAEINSKWPRCNRLLWIA